MGHGGCGRIMMLGCYTDEGVRRALCLRSARDAQQIDAVAAPLLVGKVVPKVRAAGRDHLPAREHLHVRAALDDLRVAEPSPNTSTRAC